jgi:hypothetical protein
MAPYSPSKYLASARATEQILSTSAKETLYSAEFGLIESPATQRTAARSPVAARVRSGELDYGCVDWFQYASETIAA